MTNFSDGVRKKALQVAATIAKKSVSSTNKWGWPPDCIGLFYPIQRPDSLRKEYKSPNTK